MAANNEDTLTRIVLTAVGTLKGDVYFTPTDGRPAIPVVEDVAEDIFAAIKRAEIRGALVAVSSPTIGGFGTGGCLTGTATLDVRCQEIVGQNRSASGVLDNAARIADKVAQILHGSPCCLREDGSKMTGGAWKLESIDITQALGSDGAPLPQGRAYSVKLSGSNISLIPFTRRTTAPPAGAP